MIITENTTNEFAAVAGTKYVFSASGDFGGGTISLQWSDGTEWTSFTDCVFSADGTQVVTAPVGMLRFLVEGTTNPSISANVFPDPSGGSLSKSDIGLGNVDNTSDETKNAAAATLTNKVIDFSRLAGVTMSRYTLMPNTLKRINATGNMILSILATGDSLLENKLGSLDLAFQDTVGYAGLGIGRMGGVVTAGSAAQVSGDFTYSPDGRYWNIPVGGAVKFNYNTTDSVVGNKFLVPYIVESGGGTFKIQYSTDDGSTWTDQVTGLSASGSLGCTVYSVTKSSTNTAPYMLKVVNTGASGAVKIPLSPAVLNTLTRGAVLHSFAKGSSGLSNWLACIPAITSPLLAAIAPDLVIYENTDTPADQASYLLSWITQLQAGYASCDILACLMNDISGGTSAAQNDVIWAIAAANNWSVFDDYTWGISYAVSNAAGLMADSTHRNTAGNNISAGLMIQQSPIKFALYGQGSRYRGLAMALASDSSNPAYSGGYANYNGATSGNVYMQVIKHVNASYLLYVYNQSKNLVGGFAFNPGNASGNLSNSIMVLGYGGAPVVNFGSSGNISLGTASDPIGRVDIVGSTDGSKPSLVVRPVSGQTGDLIRCYTPGSTSSIVWRVDSSGTIKFAAGNSVLSGTGTPEGATTAPVGSMFLRTDGSAGTCLYIKESGAGNTGWAAK